MIHFWRNQYSNQCEENKNTNRNCKVFIQIYIIQHVYVGSTNYEGYDFVITMFKTVYIYTLSEINFRKIWNRSLSASCMLEFFN